MRPGLFIRIVLPCLALLAPVAVVAQTVSLGTGQRQVMIQVGDAAALPADFPEDVFLPPGAQLQRVQRDPDGTQLLEFALAGTPDAAVGQYPKTMDAAGWTRARVAPVANARVLAWEKDQRALLLMALPATDGASTRLHLQLRSRRGSPAAH